MYFNQVKFGCRLRNLRKQRRMTQEALAGSLNISIDHLSKIEHGKRGVSIDLLLDISEALDVSLDYLLKGTIHTSLQMKDLIGRMQELHDQMAAIYGKPVLTVRVFAPKPGLPRHTKILLAELQFTQAKDDGFSYLEKHCPRQSYPATNNVG